MHMDYRWLADIRKRFRKNKYFFYELLINHYTEINRMQETREKYRDTI
jgi:hypothetical protein